MHGIYYTWLQDVQMNIEEVEDALKTINGHLLTEKEMQFIYHVSLQQPSKDHWKCET